MIKYALRCARSHAFEAWFQSAAAYDAQAAAGQIECPVCGVSDVAKQIMAPAIGRKRSATTLPADPASEPHADAAPNEPPAPDADAQSKAAMLAAAPPEVRKRFLETKLRALRAFVEANAESVGGSFAEEARKIHQGEAPERAIYGDATPEEAEELADEGVPVARIPWIDRRDD